MLICSDTFLIACSYVHMHCWSHAFMFTCLDDSRPLMYVIFLITYPLAYMPSSSYAQTYWWLPTPMLKYFDYCMLTCIDIYMFEIHTNVHTCGSWNVYWFGGISVTRYILNRVIWDWSKSSPNIWTDPDAVQEESKCPVWVFHITRLYYNRVMCNVTRYIVDRVIWEYINCIN